MIESETTIAHYRVEGRIGSGGMGEVYRALDTRLGRSVALKILPAESGQSRLRIRRFLQEARAASSLNHPNILTVYDAGEVDQLHFIASELIAGNTLGDLIHRDRVPLKRLIDYLAQAADGIAKAHAAGIVHRDLKPDNIMVTFDGFAKVLDFGLAKLAESGDQHETIPGATREGLVIGTIAYMSPEQAQGRAVDHRSDIFSFGAILYEAAARRQPFRAPSDPETLHQIIHDDPPPLTGIPTELERLITRAMAKDPEERIQSMKDLALELREIARNYEGLRIRTTARRRVSMRAGAWIAIVIAALAAGAGIGRFIRRKAPVTEPIRFTIAPPEKMFFTAMPNSSTALQFAVSPDTRSMVFVAAAPERKPQLWLREFSSIEARPIPGTEGAWFPFWSPKGDAVGFFADGKLKRITLGSSSPVVLADAPDPRGGSWSADDAIVYAPRSGGALYRIPAGGGEPVPATKVDPARGDRAHRWPSFLPDGKRFLYLALAPSRGVYAASLAGNESRLVLANVDSNAQFVAPDALLFVRRGSLYVQRIDPKSLRVEGEPSLLEQHVGYAPILFYGAFSAANEDLIAFATRINPNRQLTWIDRRGRVTGTATDPANWVINSLSVSGERALVPRDSDNGNLDLWLVDLRRRIASPFSTDPGDENHPVWSPNGEEIAYTSNRTGLPEIYVKPFVNAKADRHVVTGNSPRPWSWTPDGRQIIYWDRSPETNVDLWIVNSDGRTPPRPLLKTEFNDSEGIVSPDGRWLAYTSDDSGREEVYVQPFGREGPRNQISSDGGNNPQWSADGREIFFITRNAEIAAARVHATATQFEAALPAVLFRIPGLVTTGPAFLTGYAATRDGRFLVNVTPADASPSTITAVVHWRPHP